MRAFFVSSILVLLAAVDSFQSPLQQTVASHISRRRDNNVVGSIQSAFPLDGAAAATTGASRGVLARQPSYQAATVTGGGSSNEPTEWTEKRVHNTAAFRSFAILVAMLVAGFSSKSPTKFLPAQVVASVHTLSFATWFGTVAYTTFVAGITMFQNLPRQTFGRLQSKLFPKYFAISSFALVLQLVTLKGLSAMKGSIAHTSAKALGIALLMTLLNQFVLEPKSTRVMLDRYELENVGDEQSDRYKELKASFGKLHGMSSLTNLIALCAGVVHAVSLASTLVLR